MFSLKRYFVLITLYKYISRIKFIYYKLIKLKHYIDSTVVGIKYCIDIIDLYCKIKATKRSSFIFYDKQVSFYYLCNYNMSILG